MGSVTEKSGWVEDAALGVAVREAGGELYVKPLTAAGCSRIDAAADASFPGPGVFVRVVSEIGLTAIIDSAHRVAFARALGLAEPQFGMSEQHTPGPIYPLGRCNHCHWYWDRTSGDVEVCQNCGADDALMDMPEIAIACNAHADLIAACKAAEFHYAMMCKVICPENPPPGALQVLKQLRAALAKAGKGVQT